MQNQIPKNWQKVKLGELANLIPGFAFKSGDFTTDGTPVIKIRNIASGTLTLDNLEYFAGNINSLDKYKINKGDILVSMTGSHVSQWSSVVGKITRNNKDQVFLMNQRVGKIKPNPAKVDNDFLYYILHNDETTLNLANRAGGSANQANISPEIIKSLEISIPELEDQKKIASVISVFDDKIEVNNKIAKTLEEMAQALFKEWFVKLKFPGYEKTEFLDSELGKIPKGWRIKRLGELIQINRGLSYNGAGLNKNGLPMINLGCFLRGGVFSYENLKFYNGSYRQTQLVKAGDIVVANTDITQNREIIGNPAIVYSINGFDEFLFTHHVFAIRNNSDYSNQFFYFLLRTSTFRARAAGFATGTNVLALPKDALLQLQIILPPQDLVANFSDFANNVFRKKIIYQQENQKLESFRDLLLPKLMKGEIRV